MLSLLRFLSLVCEKVHQYQQNHPGRGRRRIEEETFTYKSSIKLQWRRRKGTQKMVREKLLNQKLGSTQENDVDENNLLSRLPP